MSLLTFYKIAGVASRFTTVDYGEELSLELLQAYWESQNKLLHNEGTRTATGTLCSVAPGNGKDGYLIQASINAKTTATAVSTVIVELQAEFSTGVFTPVETAAFELKDDGNSSAQHHFKNLGHKIDGDASLVYRLEVITIDANCEVSGSIQCLNLNDGESPRPPAQTTGTATVTVTGDEPDSFIPVRRFDGNTIRESDPEIIMVGYHRGDTIKVLEHTATNIANGAEASIHEADDTTPYQNNSGNDAWAILQVRADSADTNARRFEIYSAPTLDSSVGATKVFDSDDSVRATSLNANGEILTTPVVGPIQNGHYIVLKNKTGAAGDIDVTTHSYVIEEKS